MTKGLKQRKKTNVSYWILLITVVSSLFFFLFQGGKLASMLFVMVLVLSLYLIMGKWSGIAHTRGKRSLHGLEYEGIVPAGTSVSVHIQSEIPGYWPIPYVVVKDRLTRRNGEEITFEGTFVPDWRRQGKLEYTTPPMRRGYYQFSETTCTTEDVFGLFKHEGILQLSGGFGVLPQTIPIKEWRQYRDLAKGMHQQSVTNRSMRETTQINGVREYHYGDRLSRIHWNATAKTGEFKSKEFERESLPKSILVLDRQAEAYVNQEQFELAVSIAASLLEFAAQKDIAMGMLSVGKDSVFFDSKRSSIQQRLMMDHLIEVDPDGDYSLFQVLEDRKRSFTAGSFFAIISPRTSDSLVEWSDWMERHQMNCCHFWIPSDHTALQQELWLSQLHKNNMAGYAVRALRDLPNVLGGRSA